MQSAAEPAEIRALEHAGYRLWVAPEVEELDGWRLRHAHGLTGRGNSVFPNGDGSLPLEERIALVERWCAERGLPARFQLTDASLPSGLAAALEARGYEPDQAATGVHTAAADGAGADPRVELLAVPDDGWVGMWAGSRSFDDRATARALLTGSPGATVFARLGTEAVGRAVACDGVLGITSMVTVPTARRRGLGRAIVSTLLAWGAGHGCCRALLQVERGNTAARALYAAFGFEERYEYAYAVAPAVAVL